MGQAESVQKADDLNGERIGHYYSMPTTIETRASTNSQQQQPVRINIGNKHPQGAINIKPPFMYPRENSGQHASREVDSTAEHKAIINSRIRHQPVSVFNVEDKMNEFDAEQKRLEEAMERVKARRLAAFEKELQDFEASYNPFEVLGLSRPTDDINLVKKAYHKQSLKYHPDKGGDEQKFALITKAYMYIAKRIEKMNIKVASQIELKEQAQDYFKQSSGMQNIHVDKNNFNKDRFNEVFASNRLQEPEDEGYGDTMDMSDRSKEPDTIETKRAFDGKFNREIFNSVFDSGKSDERSKQVTVYQDPQPLISSGLDYYELGQGKTDDFGKSERVTSGQFTDYKRAYSTDSKLIDPASVDYKTYQNIEEYERDRKNIKTLTPDERRRIELQERREELDEEERLLRMKERDDLYEKHFKKMNNLMLGR